MPLLGELVAYWRSQLRMTLVETAECLIAHGFADPGFTTAQQLADLLARIEAGDPWPLGDSSRRPFIDCFGRCFGPQARGDAAVAMADDILRGVTPGLTFPLRKTTPETEDLEEPEQEKD